METTRARLGDVLRKSDRWVTLEPETTYQEIKVRVNGKGVVPRGTRAGMEISSNRGLEVRGGQFIISRIDARHGASGIIPHELDAGVVTNDFPVFDVDNTKLDSQYLHWLSKTEGFVEACRAASEGTTNRVRLREERFAEIEVALPALPEQKRVAARIDAVAERLDAANQLRHEIQNDANALLQSVFHRLIEGAEYRPLAEVAPIVRRPVEIDLDREYEEIGIRSFHKGTFFKCTSAGVDISHKKMFHICPGDLAFSNIMAWEGAIAVVKPQDEHRIGVHRFITCVPKPGTNDPHFLWFYFQTGEGFQKIVEASPATIARNRTLSVKKLEEIQVPIPTFGKQADFAQLKAKVDAIRDLRSAGKTELDALLPAVLDKAFRGDL